jgi:HlyD family secretion protein
MNMKNRRKIGIILAILSLAVLMTACSSAEGENIIIEVDLSEVERQVEAFGRVIANEEMSVIIDIQARVGDIFVRDGQRVSYGEPVLNLIMTDYENEIAAARSDLAIARAETGAQSSEMGKETNRLQQNLAFAEAELAEARADHEISRQLYDAGAIPKAELERCKRDMALKEKQVQEIALQLEQRPGSGRIGVYREQAAALENKLNQLQAKMNQSYLNGSQVVSPFNQSVVMDLALKSGDRIDPGSPVLRFINLDSLVVQADVLEEFVRDVKIGASVTMIPAADRTRTYHGRVESISDAAYLVNYETIVPVRVSILDADDFLRPNFNVDIYIDIQ